MISSSDSDIQLLEVAVNRVTSLMPGIKEFELVPGVGLESLPAASPGAHIKVRIGNGHWRAYSVVNHEDSERYVIAVRLCGGFSEGSQYLHDFVEEGDVLEILPPENGFALAEQAERAVLLAGGIGITPLIGLGRKMKALGMAVEFHYLGRREDDMAYVTEVGEAFGADAHFYFTDSQGVPALAELIGAYRAGTHLYACGPESMLRAIREESADWPADNLHFELFVNPPDSPASIAQPAYAFEVKLARSWKCCRCRRTGRSWKCCAMSVSNCPASAARGSAAPAWCRCSKARRTTAIRCSVRPSARTGFRPAVPVQPKGCNWSSIASKRQNKQPRQ